MPSLYFSQPQLSQKLLQSRYRTEYLTRFCKDSTSVLHGHRQFPEHVWLQQRPVGSQSFRVDEVPPATYLRPPYASRLTYYDEMKEARKSDDPPRCHTTYPRHVRKHVTEAAKGPRPKSEGSHGTQRTMATNAKEAIDKMTLQRYRERNYDNMIGPRVFFHPTIPRRRHDYVIHPAFHSEDKRRPRNVQVRKHAIRKQSVDSNHKKTHGGHTMKPD